MRYVTAQVPGGKLTMPEEYLHLDGWQDQFITEQSLSFGRKCNLTTRGIAVNGRPGPAGQGKVQDCPHEGFGGEGKKMIFVKSFTLAYFLK